MGEGRTKKTPQTAEQETEERPEHVFYRLHMKQKTWETLSLREKGLYVAGLLDAVSFLNAVVSVEGEAEVIEGMRRGARRLDADPKLLLTLLPIAETSGMDAPPAALLLLMCAKETTDEVM